jgi:hypothetical protein
MTKMKLEGEKERVRMGAKIMWKPGEYYQQPVNESVLGLAEKTP